MTTLQEAQKDYICRWDHNARQHFIEGDYDWVADLVSKAGVKRVLEIGCGSGYSTLALVNRGIKVISIDSNPIAIKETIELLQKYGFSVDEAGCDNEETSILIKSANAIEDFVEASSYAYWAEMILICNPGGKLEEELSSKEREMLTWGHYPDEQIEQESVFVLHKWAILLSAARMAKEYGKPLMIVERGGVQELNAILEAIQIGSRMECVDTACRAIKPAPSNGIKLGNDTGKVFWGVGLYLPK